ncbi:hypothetical protein UNSWDHB_1398 [Dehalobacter sp. UNSWDHB]|nr:hypothetical protein DHBDCA_p2058 [Dehalobacter sp. DCA]AFV06074.1 hypothetical protein DCF50_p2071 [Dehalobacter sp. CF]EQB21280.1 hypothetical protein UNSWDHB_1398 [Dehalobacter sp. UNSWDHB]
MRKSPKSGIMAHKLTLIINYKHVSLAEFKAKADFLYCQDF